MNASMNPEGTNDAMVFDRTRPDHLFQAMRPVVWKGVVAIECVQQNGWLDFLQLTTIRESLRNEDLVWVKSARLLRHNGKRMICCRVEWGEVKHFFNVDDTDSVYAYAELTGGDGGHLQFYERASQREFFTVDETSVVKPAAIAAS